MDEMNMVLHACVIMNRMIVKVQKYAYLYDGVIALRGLRQREIFETPWHIRRHDNTAREFVLRSMRSVSDQYRLKSPLCRPIYFLIKDESLV